MTSDVLDPNRLLAEIDITEQEEQAYKLLLARGALAAHEVSAALQLSEAQGLQLLAALASKALVERVPDAELRFVPSTPEVAIEALIVQKQATLERTRSAIATLSRVGQESPPSPPASCVEVITGRTSLLQAHGLLRSLAQRELRCLMPTPCMMPNVSFERELARAAGVRCLRVVDSAAIKDRAAIEHFCGPVAPLDECRFSQTLPLALTIADRGLALLPLNMHNPEGPALLVRPSSLLDGLNAMFELIWAQATPVGFPIEATAADARSLLSSELESLIPLLAAGLNDKAIAHRLHISVRTLIRRVTKLLTVLDARSRFQAGWASALLLHGIRAPDSGDTQLSVPESTANGNHATPRRAH